MADALGPNFVNRTMRTADNFDVLRGPNDNCIDLIYAELSFNGNKNYEPPIGSKAAGAAFKDTWTLSDADVAWHGQSSEPEPKFCATIGRNAVWALRPGGECLVVRHVIIFGYGHGLQRAIIDESQHRTPERLIMAQH